MYEGHAPILSTSNRIPTRGRAVAKNRHVYFLLIVAIGTNIVMSDCTIVTASQSGIITIIVQFDKTIVLSRKLATGSIHDYICLLLPPSGYSI